LLLNVLSKQNWIFFVSVYKASIKRLVFSERFLSWLETDGTDHFFNLTVPTGTLICCENMVPKQNSIIFRRFKRLEKDFFWFVVVCFVTKTKSRGENTWTNKKRNIRTVGNRYPTLKHFLTPKNITWRSVSSKI